MTQGKGYLRKDLWIARLPELKDALTYDQETGVFTWKRRVANKIHIGDGEFADE
jgi:hypothetical protein